jgi:hypothetical protein
MTKIEEIIKKIQNEYLIQQHFENEDEIICKNKGCKIKINITNFTPKMIKDKIKSVCSSCFLL